MDYSDFDLLLKRFVQNFGQSQVVYDYEGPLVIEHRTDFAQIAKIYSKLPGVFPPLYERLVLTYRWQRVEVGELFELFANPQDETLEHILDGPFNDKGLLDACLSNGFYQFGSGPGWYDPLCFDLSRKTDDGDYAIVQLDHEQILCNRKIKIVQTLAPSFRELVEKVVSA